MKILSLSLLTSFKYSLMTSSLSQLGEYKQERLILERLFRLFISSFEETPASFLMKMSFVTVWVPTHLVHFLDEMFSCRDYKTAFVGVFGSICFLIVVFAQQ